MFLSDYPYFPDYSDVIFRLKPRCLALPTQKNQISCLPSLPQLLSLYLFFLLLSGFFGADRQKWTSDLDSAGQNTQYKIIKNTYFFINFT